MRRDVAFKTLDGLTLRGWHFTPDEGAGPWPIVVMCHGFSAVKEMRLDAYAEVFAAAGLAVLAYDNRNLGASDGEPRQEVDAVMQVRDFHDAISFAQDLPGSDPERVGIWGSSYSGGHVLVVGALDRRVKCVVAQVPFTPTLADLASGFPPMPEERRRRARGEPPMMLKVVAEDGEPSALPTPDSFLWFSEAARAAPGWRNEVTLLSFELGRSQAPAEFAPFVSPTPLLMLVAENDVVAPTAMALAAFERANEPKNLTMLPGGHFDPYYGPGFDQSSSAARDWFVGHLRG